MQQHARADIHLDAVDDAPAAQRLDFLREARTALHTGKLPCGCPLTADNRDLLASYVAHLSAGLRPRLVAGTEVW